MQKWIDNNTNIALELKDLTIKDLNNEVLIDNISYQFEKGKIHYICGPSGCGKTVLISHFNGLMIPESGQIKVLGNEIKYNGKKVKHVKQIRKHIGMVFQFAEYQLFKATIRKDIMFGPINFGKKKKVAYTEAEKFLNMTGMSSDFLERNPFGLSGGQKRRVAIAGILAIEPDVLVFDEPTAGLDPHGEKEMLDIFVKLKEAGKTIIVVTHTISHAMEIADNLIVINNKKIVKDGNVYDVFLDKKVTSEASLSIPPLFTVVEKLSNTDNNFSSLLTTLRPRTIEQLAIDVRKIKNHEKK